MRGFTEEDRQRSYRDLNNSWFSLFVHLVAFVVPLGVTVLFWLSDHFSLLWFNDGPAGFAIRGTIIAALVLLTFKLSKVLHRTLKTLEDKHTDN